MIKMVSCNTCKYCVNRKGTFIVCTYFNQLVDTKKHNGCPSFKSVSRKYGVQREIDKKGIL